jgi:hypothetical protein
MVHIPRSLGRRGAQPRAPFFLPQAPRHRRLVADRPFSFASFHQPSGAPAVRPFRLTVRVNGRMCCAPVHCALCWVPVSGAGHGSGSPAPCAVAFPQASLFRQVCRGPHSSLLLTLERQFCSPKETQSPRHEEDVFPETVNHSLLVIPLLLLDHAPFSGCFLLLFMRSIFLL